MLYFVDVGRVTMATERTLKVLRGLGLTEYEAKTYVSLTSLVSATPRDVAGLAGIPYPSAYDALEALTKKGWVEVAFGKPRRYRARSPELIEKDSIAAVRDVFSELKKLYESSREKGEKPEIIYTITGKMRVIKKIEEMLQRAEKEVIMVLPNYKELHLNAVLNSLIAKGIKIKLITEPTSTFPEKAEVKFRKPILAVDILVDGIEAMISLPDYSVCGWVENPTIAKHFKEFLELLWKS